VQEAADEDANIIFGAVVDPALKGKVKITVIATGFAAELAARPAASAAQTPVDMTRYGEQTRLRADVPSVASGVDRLPTPRMSLARRPLIELPAPSPQSVAAAGTAVEDDLHGDIHSGAMTTDDPGPFDVPAFLRRQES
jgi:cell division protein FtsZ